jgi:lysophospholipase L1-like esterase
MRRRNYYYRSPQRPWWQVGLLILGGLLALILVLELLLRLFGGNFLKINPSLKERYELSLATSQGEPILGSPPHGLKVKFSSPLPYELVPNQTSPFWQINPQGMRDGRPVPQVKPPQEVRIFLLGGSTAFGSYAPNNESTIGALLEKKLQARVAEQKTAPQKFQPPVLPFFVEQVEAALALPYRIPDRTYRVINSAVPGYTSQEELSLLSHEILQLQPDYLILLDGYGDLMPPAPLTRQLDFWLQHPGVYFRHTLSQRLGRFWRGLYLNRLIQKLYPPPAIPLVKPKLDPNWLDRWQKYRFHLKQMGKLAQGKPFLLIIQPEITGNLPRRDESETKILDQLDSDYRQVINQSLGSITPETLKSDLPQATVRNYYSIFKQFPQPAFVDPIHLTPAANEFIAEQIFHEVIKSFRLNPEAPPPVPDFVEEN